MHVIYRISGFEGEAQETIISSLQDYSIDLQSKY